MTNILICELVDIDSYPQSVVVEEGNQITIGDLHGNALKLFHFLIKHGIVECHPEQYHHFVEIYKKTTQSLNINDLVRIKDICENLIIKSKTKICLIGDELADRGQNDYFTLLLINKLHKESVPIDILLSNHGYTFIEQLETNEVFRSPRPWGNREFARSMHQLQDLIDEQKLTKEEIITLAEESYLPNLKLLSYVINGSNEVTIFSHAKIDEEIIARIANLMNLEFKSNTVNDLVLTIDVINYCFQQDCVANKLVHALPMNLEDKSKNEPIVFLIWNRIYDVLDQWHHSYNINYVHGHDSQGPDIEGDYCLNNQLGYTLAHHEGQYNVLVSPLEYHLTAEIKKDSISLRSSEESTFVNEEFRKSLIGDESSFYKEFAQSPTIRGSFFNHRMNQAETTQFHDEDSAPRISNT